MSRSQDLAARFREVYLEGKWIANTNYKDQIMSTSWHEANQGIGSLNTIALLTFQINYYIQGVLEVFEGRELMIQDKFSFDCHMKEILQDG